MQNKLQLLSIVKIMQKNSLPRSEWWFIVGALIVMIALVGVAKVNLYRARSEIQLFEATPDDILVTVNGEVFRPGEYKMESGTTLETVLKKARPKRFANLANLSLKEKIYESVCIEIPTLSQLQIQIGGEIREPVSMTVKVGARVCDLKSQVVFTEETDRKFFQKKRLLKDGDIIVVPKKKKTT
ncbi:MAG: hypothetical protein A3D96_01440 [Chlamydiae bacterium RIFCSPHIGHO2_12_FULL_44_59]|nr:MAG: hypothetical protein A2796_01015 [Chlamydiae bacterium RIFCSPHIGHO2_01_FULL_44_39]OGN60524.1 MAG: hypothetical protein A3D96_01440 [Chlamydiae bacterium RIFCSPHIGHO2_12_FULL_44_59]OGN65979.1 MAG: hypothetical protein A2978_04730 [Chlamydiae bacterium RIFCSPLOWO2_01_FULL_44_52]OGN68794.1 MAG: hypothetical protein A3I67_00390 [Chlamydiae bacterium RIFCSPLOWO2_02_FULL_45_22]OGN70434.1 MAG: hypothetical protein A3F79_00750 [Chlamydiae bacterium RIFCSPLOWO2_12_FULL_45_20]